MLATLAGSGCASMSEQECRAGDWEALGRADGESGARGDEIERHQEACARHDVAVSGDAWRAGYARGLAGFCSPKGGYVTGRSGKGHGKVCSGSEQEKAFLVAFDNGKEVHRLMGEIREIRRLRRNFEMAEQSGDYSDSDINQMRMRGSELEVALQRRQWELETLDERYCAEYGAPRLTGSD